MQTFVYQARDSQTHRKVSAEIEAQDENAAAKILHEKGLVPLEIKKKQAPLSFSRWRNRVPIKQRIIFSRQLSTLVSAGLPLVQSLRSVGDQATSKPLKEAIDKIIADVESGSTLSDALAQYPAIFDNLYISLVAAGETSGTLDESLSRLASQQEKDHEILSKVRGALIYPAIVMLVLVAVVIFMLTTVLPAVEGLYNDLPNVQLPLVTRILLGISHVIRNFWWLLLLVVAGGGFMSSRYFRTGPGKEFIDNVKLNAPGIGHLYRKLYMARFARIGSTLVASGVPIIQMLNTVANAVGNVHVTASIDKATEQVKSGKPLSDSLEGDPNFTELVPSMIRIGEQSGSLEGMLERVADYYEKEVDNQIKTLSTIIEPVLIIFVGVMAMIVVAAVLLPIYSLAGKVGGV